MNSMGRIVVSANLAPLQGDEFTALMVDRGNGLEMVFRSLAIAPGFGSEFIVAQFGSRRFINSTGQILIGTKVKGPGTSESGQDVLYLIETDFTVRRVAWAGMTATLANGESVVLEKIAGTPSTFPSVIPAGDDDGQPTMLNNLGEFAFIGLWQGDGKVRSGVFVAHKAVRTRELTLKLAYDPQGSWKLLFPTLSGQTYYLQSRNAVDQGVWENFGASHLGDGETAMIPLPIEPGRDGKFFRVATTP